MSALLTTTMMNFKVVIDALERAGVRESQGPGRRRPGNASLRRQRRGGRLRGRRLQRGQKGQGTIGLADLRMATSQPYLWCSRADLADFAEQLASLRVLEEGLCST